MPSKPNSSPQPSTTKFVTAKHKPFKTAGIIIAIIVLVIIAVAVLLPFIINPNDFKPRIERFVKAKTGRELSIPGNIKLSVFPWLGAQIGPMSLSNARGFGNTPFASINETDVHVQFWPLLHGKIVVGTVKLDGIDLDLERDTTGHNNWQDIIEHLRNSSSSKQGRVASSSHSGLENLRVQGLELSNSGLVWRNAEKHQQYTISNLNMDMGEFSPGRPVRFSTDFDFAGTNPSLNGHAAFKGTVVADFAKKIYSASNAKFDLKAKGDAVPGGQVNAELLWNQAALNLGAGTLALNGLSVSAYGLKAQMDVEGQKLFKDPNFNGSLKLAAFSPRSVLQALGHENLVKTRDPQALTEASGSLNFIASPAFISVQNLSVKLDSSSLSGTASIKDIKTRALAFNLSLDQINLDHYLPPQKNATVAKPREQTDINKVSIPVRTLRSLNLDGQLHIGNLTFLGVHASNADVNVSAHQGLVRINPMSLQLYGGSLGGTAQIDASRDTPILTEDLRLRNLQVGPLIHDLFKVKRISGTANIFVATRSLGPTVGEIRHTLEGHMTFSFRNGALEGVNIWNTVARAYALVKHQPPPPPAANRTEFVDMHGTARINHGVLNNRDFAASLPYMNLRGEGKLDLAELTLDYNLQAKVTRTPNLGSQSSLNGLAGSTIPLHISGTLSNLSVRPDLGAIARSRVESELKKKKSELRKKLENKLKDFLHPPG